MSAYEWKTKGVYKVDANDAANEIMRIRDERGTIEPYAIVDESRDERAVLHGCFEWDDTRAAERYREHQASGILRNITVVSDSDETESVRAFVRVSSGYQPMSVVIENRDMTEELLQIALRELQYFKRKYSTLSKLQPVIKAIEEVVDD